MQKSILNRAKVFQSSIRCVALLYFGSNGCFGLQAHNAVVFAGSPKLICNPKAQECDARADAQRTIKPGNKNDSFKNLPYPVLKFNIEKLGGQATANNHLAKVDRLTNMSRNNLNILKHLLPF